MKRGPKPAAPATKLARGTFQPVRDGLKTEIIVPGDPPMMPEYLTPPAQLVWQEEIGRVMAAGTCELDSSMFARYCSMEALVREAFSSAKAAPPPAAVLTVLRQHAEMLGIAGRKSRVGKVFDDPSRNSNPFARNGHRARA